MEAGEIAQTLGWAIRLLRYYRAVPDAEIVRPVGGSRTTGPQLSESAAPTQRADSEPRAAQAQPAHPAAPQLPAAGDTFAGKVIAVDETAVLVAIPGFVEDKATGVMKAEAIEGRRTDRYREGNMARRGDGRADAQERADDCGAEAGGEAAVMYSASRRFWNGAADLNIASYRSW